MSLLKEVDTQMEEVVFDHLHTTAFQETPLSWTILGPSKNIRLVKEPSNLSLGDTGKSRQ